MSEELVVLAERVRQDMELRFLISPHLPIPLSPHLPIPPSSSIVPRVGVN